MAIVSYASHMSHNDVGNYAYKPATPNYPLRRPKDHQTEARRAVVEVLWGVQVQSMVSAILPVLGLGTGT